MEKEYKSNVKYGGNSVGAISGHMTIYHENPDYFRNGIIFPRDETKWTARSRTQKQISPTLEEYKDFCFKNNFIIKDETFTVTRGNEDWEFEGEYWEMKAEIEKKVDPTLKNSLGWDDPLGYLSDFW